jgi:hypothetical protein
VDKREGRSTDPDAPTFESIAKMPGLSAAALAAALQTSHRTMPNFVIRGADADNIIAYILSLKKATDPGTDWMMSSRCSTISATRRYRPRGRPLRS